MSSLLVKGINRNAEIYIECAINVDILLYMVSVNASTNIATYTEYANKEAIGHMFLPLRGVAISIPIMGRN